jgi:MFS family permease
VARRDPAAEAAFREEVRGSLRRNYLAHLGHGLLGQTGMRLVNAPTFVPLYISSLAGFDAAAGIARGLQYLGMFLSPVLGATIIEHRRRVLPVGIVIGSLMRLQVLGLALGGLLLPDPWPLFTAWLFLALFGFFLGIQGVVFNFLVSKVIPVERRGLLMGLRNALAGVTAAVVAYYAGKVLIGGNALGNGYAATFLLGFGLTSVGLLLLLFVREPASPQVREPSAVRERLRQLPALLRSDRAFTRYFLARAMATIGRMGVPFYVLYAQDRVALDGAQLGAMTGAFILAQSLGPLLVGLVADRRGFRFVFLASLSTWMLAVVLLMNSHSGAGLVAVFAALGAGLGGFQMSAQNLVLEFGSRRNLPMRIAVANSAAELVAAFGSIAGGLLTLFVSFREIFWTALVFQAAALTIVLRFVDEPRNRGAAVTGGRR